MNFTKLRLNGFKSFVDSTELKILPGLTGIVGPNGCGKSNLLDALRWVMGENRPTSMRGDGMDDVVFGGSDLRPSRAFAEVVLELEDFDPRVLPLRSSDKNIEIMRRINLETGSIYKIEDKEVLAREVRMLFADSSTGSNSPSLVRQGQIANLINENPKSRRKILEEAAGIAGIYQRRHESELKLNASETNLARVQDILSKLQDQLKVLAKQAREANEYRSLGMSIRKEESLLLYAQWIDKKREVESAENQLAVILKARTLKQSKYLDLSKEREKKEESLPSLREKQAIDQIAFRQLQSMKDNFDEKHSLSISRIDELKKRMLDLDSEYLREKELSRDAEGVLQKLIIEKKELDGEQINLEKKLADARCESEVSEIEFKKLETEYQEQATNYAKLIAEKNSLEKNHEDYKKNYNIIKERLLRVESDKTHVNCRRKEIEREKKKAEEFLQEKETLVATQYEALKEYEKDCQDSNNAHSEGKEKLSESRSKFAAIVSEINALEELTKDKTIDSDAILNKVSATAGYEMALGVILSEELNFPGQSTGTETGWLKNQEYFEVKKLPEDINVLVDFVDHPQELSRRLKNVGIVDSKDGPRLQSKLLDGQSLVSREGDIWRWDGFVRRSSDSISETALKLKNINRLKKLQVLQMEVEQSVSRDLENYEFLEKKFQKLLNNRDISKKEYLIQEKKLSNLKNNLSKLEAEFEINRAQLEGLTDKSQRLNNDLKELSVFIGKYQIDAGADQDLISLEKSLNEKKYQVEDYRSKNLHIRLKLEDILSKDEHRKSRLGQISAEIKEWASRQKRSLEQQTDIMSRKKEFQGHLDMAIIEPENIKKEVESLAEKILDAEKKCVNSTEVLIEAEKGLRNSLVEERESQKLAQELKEEYVRAEVGLETIRKNMEEVAVSLEDNTGLTPKNFEIKIQKEINDPISISSIQQKLEKLNRKRDTIGPVNLRAEEDEKEIADEFENLSAQRDDLGAAIRKLRKAISDLNQEGRGKLINAFEEVNKNFKELFKTLFGGGSSNLMFIESDDPLEAGLEIMCQPPGKKLSNLSLLSGGEQTLAAISLIFAVFLARPSPICVLDEVDAPLDDANVVRFCRLLDDMNSKTNTRFLIITHNPITMAKMNRLYGVTMAEKGVSQLVSVDLDRAEELVEA